MSENRISGNEDRFNQDDFVIDTREDTKSCQDLSEPSQESFYNSSGILLSSTIQAVKPAKILCLREKTESYVSNNIKHQVKNRVDLVDREPEVSQWQNFFSVEPRNDYSNRWLQGGEESATWFKHQGNGQRKREPYT